MSRRKQYSVTIPKNYSQDKDYIRYYKKLREIKTDIDDQLKVLKGMIGETRLSHGDERLVVYHSTVTSYSTTLLKEHVDKDILLRCRILNSRSSMKLLTSSKKSSKK